MPPKLRTILIVDDDEGMRDTLGAILKRNYRVKLAVTGEEALAVLKREDVDLILLDVRLPGINGLEVLKIVKENYTLIEVIMISAINEVETAVQAMKHGAYHYIAKEFDYDELRSLVRNALERQDLNRQVITLSEQGCGSGGRRNRPLHRQQHQSAASTRHDATEHAAPAVAAGPSRQGLGTRLSRVP